MDHGGVTIYHIDADDYLEGGARVYWYGTRPGCADDGSADGAFDVRDLPGKPDARYDEEEGRRTIIRAAIDSGLLTEDGIAAGARIGRMPETRGRVGRPVAGRG